MKQSDQVYVSLSLFLAYLVIASGPLSLSLVTVYPAHAIVQSTSLKKALDWLITNLRDDGSYGQYTEATTPGSAYALWLNDSSSPKAQTSFTWLASQLDNHSNDIGEADILGEILYSLRASGNTNLLHNSSDYADILSYQDSNGGFKGYFDSGQFAVVPSSVDTAFAVLSLTGTRSVSTVSMSTATNYLLQLQNSDGSFNLTGNKSSIGANDSLGPEPVSTTALVLFALGQASVSSSESHVSKGLSFLTGIVSTNFTSTHDNRGHVYAASFAALAFKTFGRAVELSSAQTFILSQQNKTDGGFYDVARSTKRSNPLDTGWAAVALQQTLPPQVSEQSPSLPATWLVAVVVGVVVAAILGIFVLVQRSRRKRPVPAQSV